MNWLRRFFIARAVRRELKLVREAARQERRQGGVHVVIAGDTSSPDMLEQVIFRDLREAAKQTPAKREPGRQDIKMPPEMSMFGTVRLWTPPVPRHAQSAPWVDLHRFAPGSDKQSDPRAMVRGEDPPLSFLCPGCDLEQAPITSTERDCPYCGLHLKLHGPRLFWWRNPVALPELGPWA